MNAQTEATGGLPFIVSDDDIATIKKAMRAYRYFESPADLVAEMNKVAKETTNFLGLTVFAQGIAKNESGEYVLTDASKYEGAIPVLAFVGGQTKDAKGQKTPVIKGIQAFGIPTVESALESAPDLLRKVLGKEFRHVYFRNFRDATSMIAADAGFAAAPVGIEAFAASHARSAADELDTDTFDAVWPAVRKTIVAQLPALGKLLPPKGEVIKAIRSKSYAAGVYPDLEKRNTFMMLAASVVQVASTQDKPFDVSEIKAWAQGRDSTHIDYKRITADDLNALDTFDVATAGAALGI